MKKTYIKPEAEYLRFYSEEEMDESTDLPDTSNKLDEGTGDSGWID